MQQAFSKLIAASVFLVSSQLAFAKKGPNYPKGFTPKTTSGIFFTENKGQVYDQNYKPRPDVLFGAMAGNMAFYLKTTGVSYQLYRVDKWKEAEDERTNEKRKEIDQQTIYRIDLNWVNANKNFTTTTDQTLEGYNNYYLESCPNGALNVKSYTGITLHNLYKGINLHYYEKNGQLKHDYLVAPQADYKQIQLKVEGASISINKDGSLLLSTPLGKIQEGAPIVYQNGKTLKAKWMVSNNNLKFDIENYNPNLELIIDPLTRLWGTYYGGAGQDFGNSCTTDASGNVYLAGWSELSTGTAVATTGAHQTLIGVYADAFMAQFNSSGVRQWGTYYGGGGIDRGNSCATDATGNVYMTGYTDSNTGTVIASAGAHQTVFGGNFDAFLVMFNSNGIRQWGTYYGAGGSDSGFSCATDASGNVYFSGETNSSGTVIATAGAHQTVLAINAGNTDAFLVKFNSSGVRQWGTYYGGFGIDKGPGCATDAAGNVYLAGRTDSNTGTVIATAVAHQTATGGGNDAFLVKFNASGLRQWATYYGGTGNDQGNSCATDATGNIYLAGYTDSNTGTVIATAGAHQTVNGGGVYDAFLVMFNSSGLRQWGTYYGGAGIDYGLSCTTNTSGSVILVGSTTSNTGTVIATAWEHQTVHGGGGEDAYLVKFNSSGVRQWGTYYGGNGINVGSSCTSDATGHLYIAGTTNFNTGTAIATTGAHQTVYGGSFWDGFVVRFFDCVSLSPNATANASVCVGAAINLSVSFTGTATPTFSWTGPNSYTSNLQNPGINSAILANTGIYTVIVINGICMETSTVQVTVDPIPTITVNSGSICSGQSFTLVPSGASTYTYSSGSAIVSPTSNTNYNVTGTSNAGCVSSNTAVSSVTVNALPTVSVNSGTICSGQSFTMVPGGALTYTYSSGSAIVSPTTNANYNVTGTSSLGCVSSNTAVSSVTVNITPSISVNSGAICLGQSFNMVPGGASTYTFSSGSAVVSPTSNASYNVTGTSSLGCVSSNTAVSSVTVNALPTVSVNSGTICSGQSFTMVPTGALTYTYSSGSAIVSPTANANYNVTGSSSLGCISSNTAVSSVTVYASPIITAVSSSTNYICVGESATLSASGANSYTWNSTQTSTVISVSPTVSSNYTVTGTDTMGCQNTAVVTQSVDACTGLSQHVVSGYELIIFPNPVHTKLTIVSNGSTQSVQVYNALGAQVYKTTIESEKTEIDLTQHAKGIYFVRIGKETKKLIKE